MRSALSSCGPAWRISTRLPESRSAATRTGESMRTNTVWCTQAVGTLKSMNGSRGGVSNTPGSASSLPASRSARSVGQSSTTSS